MKRLVYLDHAAATPLNGAVFKTMQPFLRDNYGNPSALYDLGVKANQALNLCRKTVANAVGTNPDSIVFTSGGSEANNLAIFGVANMFSKPGHIITTSVEHDAILKPIESLKKRGWKVTVLPVDEYGFVTPQAVIKELQPDTALVSVIYANNEIGTIEPIAEIGKEILKWRRDNNSNTPYFHTDACQAANYLDINVARLHVDLMTLNSGKVYGPKGAGCLFVKRGLNLEPLIYGGSQEQNRRAGTENVAAIVGFAEALDLVVKKQSQENTRLGKLSEFFWQEIKKAIPGAVLNGPDLKNHRLSNNLNVSIPNTDAETVLLYLNQKGIMCSTGSACTAISSTPSHVLAALKKTPAEITGSLRFTLGQSTTMADLVFCVKQLSAIINLLKSGV